MFDKSITLESITSKMGMKELRALCEEVYIKPGRDLKTTRERIVKDCSLEIYKDPKSFSWTLKIHPPKFTFDPQKYRGDIVWINLCK